MNEWKNELFFYPRKITKNITELKTFKLPKSGSNPSIKKLKSMLQQKC